MKMVYGPEEVLAKLERREEESDRDCGTLFHFILFHCLLLSENYTTVIFTYTILVCFTRSDPD